MRSSVSMVVGEDPTFPGWQWVSFMVVGSEPLGPAVSIKNPKPSQHRRRVQSTQTTHMGSDVPITASHGTPLSHKVGTTPGVSFLSLTGNRGIPDVSLGPIGIHVSQRHLLRLHPSDWLPSTAGDGPGLCLRTGSVPG